MNLVDIGSESNPIFYRDGYKYQTTKDFKINIPVHPVTRIVTDWITLDTNGDLFLKWGYAWNGPSCPTKDTPGVIRGSAVHDAGYQLIRLGLLPPDTRSVFDQIYYDVILSDSRLVVNRDYHPWVRPVMLKVVSIRTRGHYEALMGFGWW